LFPKAFVVVVGTLPASTEFPIHVVLEDEMANVFVEPRPKGKPEGSPITDYVVEDRADQ
jgi:hypothetical protein